MIKSAITYILAILSHITGIFYNRSKNEDLTKQDESESVVKERANRDKQIADALESGDVSEIQKHISH